MSRFNSPLLRVVLGLALMATSVLPLMACSTPHKKAIEAEGAVGPYSALVLSGGFCFVSGRIGERGGSFAAEAKTCIQSVADQLARVGLDLSDVVTATVFLTDMGRYQEFNGIYAEMFPAPYPARACVAVKELPVGARCEVQVIARCR